MKETVGLFVLDVKHTDHLKHVTVEFVNDVLEEWIIIVHGML